MIKYNVAVIGATGSVGKEILNILSERKFPIKEVHALASRDSLGKEVSFGEKDILKIKSLEEFDFSNVDFAFLAAGSDISKSYSKKLASLGCIVIDNSSLYRMDKNVPLIVPEVNPDDLYSHQNIIANPNCSTIQLVTVLNPLHEEFGIRRIVIATYQSVSGAGKASMDELYEQTKGMYLYDIQESVNFPKRIAFNIIPQIGEFMDDGSTLEEWKMMNETKKIMGESIEVSATCVRVPVFVGHSEAVNVEFEDKAALKQVIDILKRSPGIVVIDQRENGDYITPVECVQEDAVYVSRIREDTTVASGINLWIVADNLRKGAALNAVQIAELLIKKMKK